MSRAVPGVVHGSRSYLMQDEWARSSRPSRSPPVSNYPGVGPEHAHLAASGRARYETVTDAEVVEAFRLLSRTEGIIPASNRLTRWRG